MRVTRKPLNELSLGMKKQFAEANNHVFDIALKKPVEAIPVAKAKTVSKIIRIALLPLSMLAASPLAASGLKAENAESQRAFLPTESGGVWPETWMKSCLALRADRATVRQFLERSEKADSYEWNANFAVAPCVFRGTIRLEGIAWNFILYPTGFGVLTPPEGRESRFYICYECRIFDDWNFINHPSGGDEGR